MTTHRLSNGVELLCAARRGLPLVDLLLVVRAGAGADRPTEAGCASLVAELLEEGAAGRSGHDIACTIDSMGAFYDVRAGRDDTMLALHTLSSRLEEGLRLLADLAGRPDFPETEVRRRREMRIAALLQDRDEPAIVAGHTLARAVYGPDHPYGRPSRGTRRTVESLERDALAAFHAAHYSPAASYLVVVGDVDEDVALRAVEAALADWPAVHTHGSAPPGPPAPKRTEIVLVDRPGAPQSEIRVGCAGAPRTSPDHPTLVTLNTLLGGSFTSRLNRRLREEKGYTYGARSSFAFRAGPGPFVAGAAVFTGVTANAVEDIRAELQRLCDEPVTEEELDRARNFIVLGLPRRLETGAALAAHLSELHLHGLPADHLVHWVERVRAVSRDDIRRVAARVLDPDAMVVTVVGDRARIERPLEGLGVGPIRVHSPDL